MPNKGEWKEEYGNLNILDPGHVSRNPAYHCQNLDISALKHAYTSILNSARVH
jgi:hypothetical protein